MDTWTIEQRKYMRWICLPYPKEPRSKAAYAEAITVDYSTLWRWEQRPGWALALRKMSMLVAMEMETEVNRARVQNMLTPNGDKERMYEQRYGTPARQALYEEGYFGEIDYNIPELTNSTAEISELQAMEDFKRLTGDEQDKFRRMFQQLGMVKQNKLALVDSDPVMIARYLRPDEAAEMGIVSPELPVGPGRPRGSRKVRLRKE